jgi:Uma2 family endonuclease
MTAMATELMAAPTVGEGKLPPGHLLTYEEFLEWADDKTFAEWVDGEVKLMSPVNESHDDLSNFLTAILRIYARVRDAGRVFSAPYQMRLRNVRRGREPDVMFVAKEHLSYVTRTYLDGPADLAIEIVSPESILRDRGEKYGEYEIEGIQEYWVLDPDAKRADFYVLNANGRYDRAYPDMKGMYGSTVLPEVWVKVDWFWQKPLPSEVDILKEWKLI